VVGAENIIKKAVAERIAQPHPYDLIFM